jgi:hypothetical protein
MDTTSGAAILERTRAADYYRGAGFNRFSIRGRPGIRKRTNFVPISAPPEIPIDREFEIVVYPELTVREKPWRLWARVSTITDDIVTIERLSGHSGEETGTLVRIPIRYFADGRVLIWAGENDES